ncbi:MAG: hypothetical protein WA124_07585 [Smithella sp.]
MDSKIVLGLLMGFISGASSTYGVTAENNIGFQPSYKVLRTWVSLTVPIAWLLLLAFVIWTFVEYPVKFGFYTIGEVFIGFILSGFTPMLFRYFITLFSVPALIVVWYFF